MIRVSPSDNAPSRSLMIVVTLLSLAFAIPCVGEVRVDDDRAAKPSKDVPKPTDLAPLEITSVRVGFDDLFKLGCWTPVEVTLRGGNPANTGQIQLKLDDGDGVPTRYSTPPTALGPTGRHEESTSETWSTRLLAKFGRPDRGLTVRVVCGDQTLTSRTFAAASPPKEDAIPIALPATEELYLMLGPRIGLAEVVRPTSRDQRRRTLVAQLDDDQQLPTNWYGYDGVDTVVFSTSQPDVYRRLISGGDRLDALRLWIELGGRLIWFVGEQAPQILAADSPLAQLAPGRFAQMTELRQTTDLENYCESKRPITVDRGEPALQVPQLAGLDRAGTASRVEVDGDRGAERVPLVVRTPLGFGEIVFVAIDLDQPPLASWRGRPALLRRLLDRPQARASGSTRGVYSHGYEDLSGQLRASLDQFPTVRVLPFALVMVFSIAYILLIGPGDYFLLKRVTGRMVWTWLTFPTIVVVFSAAAYFLATNSKGDSRHLFQVELIDVDLHSGRVRGTAWCNVFSPRAETFDLTFTPNSAAVMQGTASATDPSSAHPPETLLSWMGVPGRALGGMRSAADQPVFSPPYNISPANDRLAGVPMPQWAAKSFVARWIDQASPQLAVDLTRNADFVFDDIVVGFELIEAKRPVFDGRAGRNARSTIAACGFTDHPEIPGVQTPALGPVVERGSSDRIHHRMDRRPW